MSWSRRRLLVSGLAPVLGGGALTVLLGGCGFRPLYGQASATSAATSGPVNDQLAKIKIDPIASTRNPDPLQDGFVADYDARTGQILHNYLRDGLTPKGVGGPVAYRLAITLDENVVRTLSVDNENTTREDLAIRADYELTDVKGQPLLKDSSRIITSYDISNEPFNDISVRKDARHRAAEQLGEMIRTRLAVYFTKGH